MAVKKLHKDFPADSVQFPKDDNINNKKTSLKHWL